jgi:hypothetical protein
MAFGVARNVSKLESQIEVDAPNSQKLRMKTSVNLERSGYD